MNISAPQSWVSSCCWYKGSKDPWENQCRDLFDYWNGDNIQTIRRINDGNEQPDQNGCTDCYIYHLKDIDGAAASPFSQYLKVDENASDAQKENWRLALNEFENGAVEIKSKPLTYFLNFGFTCNLSCIQCHQVPLRSTHKQQLSSDIFYRWGEHFKSALEVLVIGGEPFAIPEAIKFMRRFVDDSENEHVRLKICTNGMIIHKHSKMLAKKRKLALSVSLDGMGDTFEQIRVDSDWFQVERNVLEFKEMSERSDHQDWSISISCCLMKAVVPNLVEYANWCVGHDFKPYFFQISSSPDIEKMTAQQDIVTNPHMLLDIPDWREMFTEAANIFQAGGFKSTAKQLSNYKNLINDRLILWHERKQYAEKMKIFE